MTDRDRVRLEPTPSQAPPTPTGPSPAAALLDAVFRKVSETISGEDRNELPPLGETDLQASALAPDTQAVDPDYHPLSGDDFDFDAENFTSLPDYTPSIPFDPSQVESLSGGKFYTSKGKLVFSRGVGEAPSNKANRSHPAYQARSAFVADAYNFVLSNFDARGAGQHRDHGSPVTGQRSANSDHYSGGAFDVRASSRAEAERILAWATKQPWVSFAQVYSGRDDTLVHISAFIGHFTSGEMPTIQRDGGGAYSQEPSTTRRQPRTPTTPPAPAGVRPV